jgi:hypothetical protein
MESQIVETVAVEQTARQANVDAIHELSELQLSFVGGGIAELVGA